MSAGPAPVAVAREDRSRGSAPGRGRGTPARRPARHLADALGLCLILAVGMALWIPRLGGPLDMRYDSATYYTLGTALAEGRGYRLLNEPGQIQAIQYPPVLPLVVAAAQRVTGTSAVAEAGHLLRLLYCACFLLYGGGVYLFARRFLPPLLAALVGLVTVLHLSTVSLSDLLMTEVPFAHIGVAFALVLPCARRSRRWGIVGGFLATMGYLLRTMGLALLVAWAAEALLARRWRSAMARALVAALPVLSWQGYITYVKAQPEYRLPAYPYQRAGYQFYNVDYRENLSFIDPTAPELGKATLADWATRASRNLARMPRVFGEAVSAERGWWEDLRRELEQRAGHGSGVVSKLETAGAALVTPADPALVLLGLLAVGGLARLARRGERFVPLYVLLSAFLLSLTPWPHHFWVYVSALTPFLSLAILVLVWDAWSAASIRLRRRLGVVAAAASLVFVLAFAIEGYTLARTWKKHFRPATYLDAAGQLHEQRLFFYTDAWRSYESAVEWLRRHAGASDVLASQTPPWTYLRTGRPSVFPPAEGGPARTQALLDAVPVRYLVVGELSPSVGARQASALVQAHRELWHLVYRSPDASARVYRRDLAGSGSGSATRAGSAPIQGPSQSGPEGGP